MTKTEALRGAARVATAVASARTAEAVAQATIAVMRDFGFHSLNAVEKPAGEAEATKALLYTNAPDAQAAKYRARGYAAADPVVQRTLRGDAPRRVSGIGEERLSPVERKIFGSIQCGSGIVDGLVIPVRRSVHPDGIIMFGGTEPDLSAPAQAAMTMLGHIVYGRLEELRSGAESGQRPRLSPSEVRVLTWVAKGKPDADTALILGISERTARFHIANAKAKLRASTRVQAVALALELGLIEG